MFLRTTRLQSWTESCWILNLLTLQGRPKSASAKPKRTADKLQKKKKSGKKQVIATLQKKLEATEAERTRLQDIICDNKRKAAELPEILQMLKLQKRIKRVERQKVAALREHVDGFEGKLEALRRIILD
jgi:hypothetical protein